MNTFEYIIVGAGSAGCVLAGRLSEDPACSVLLIEAGGRPTGLLRDMPAALFDMMSRPDLNWNFIGEPEPGLDGRQIVQWRGKTLGGSSQINGLVYARGHWRDYDDWARLGGTGWSYNEVLPYFKRMETSWAGAGPYHGDAGPIGVSSPTDAVTMHDIYRSAALQAGHVLTDDYHAQINEGFTRAELTTTGGRRAGTYTAYVEPVLHRKNLTVLPQAQLSRVLITAKRATGVKYRKNGKVETATAAREVILSAGAFGSPQLLMLSGIGPAAELRSNGIEPLIDLPGVGANLVDHPSQWLHFTTVTPTFLDELRMDRATGSVLRWALRGDGPFSTNCCGGHLFTRSTPAADRPDLQLSCFSIDRTAKQWLPLVSPRGAYGVGLMVQLVRPDSRGSVRLASADPLAAPRITLNLLTESSDMKRLIKGVEIGRQLFRQPALQRIGAMEDEPGPGCVTEADLEAFIRRTCFIGAHPIGTCKMGDDAMSVVDAQLRVHGIEGLRVVDASIMPTIPGGNTNAPTIMIAEKAADLLRGRTLPAATLNHSSTASQACAGNARELAVGA